MEPAPLKSLHYVMCCFCSHTLKNPLILKKHVCSLSLSALVIEKKVNVTRTETGAQKRSSRPPDKNIKQKK